MGIDKCVIFFFVKTIADNQRCFSSYCVIVLSDRGSAPLQSTPATRPFIGMLMQTLQHNTIMQHNNLTAHLLALYMCCCIVIMMAYPRCFCLFEGLEWSNNKRRRHLSKSVKDETNLARGRSTCYRLLFKNWSLGFRNDKVGAAGGLLVKIPRGFPGSE